MGKIVGIDFGLKRIGIAISDERKSFALPFSTIPTEHGLAKSCDSLLRTLSDPKEFEAFVVGLPLHLSGKESDLSKLVRAFVSELEKKVSSPVILFDERMSSSHADSLLKEKGLNRKGRKKHVDTLAATLILQSYLDTLSQKNF